MAAGLDRLRPAMRASGGGKEGTRTLITSNTNYICPATIILITLAHDLGQKLRKTTREDATNLRPAMRASGGGERRNANEAWPLYNGGTMTFIRNCIYQITLKTIIWKERIFRIKITP